MDLHLKCLFPTYSKFHLSYMSHEQIWARSSWYGIHAPWKLPMFQSAHLITQRLSQHFITTQSLPCQLLRMLKEQRQQITHNPTAPRKTTTPTNQPTNQPTTHPTNQPTNQATNQPTNQPTTHPPTHPPNQPSKQPTNQPTNQPPTHPTNQPTNQPTNHNEPHQTKRRACSTKTTTIQNI